MKNPNVNWKNLLPNLIDLQRTTKIHLEKAIDFVYTEGQELVFLVSVVLSEKCPYLEFFGSHFPIFRLNTERYFVSFRIQSECR